MISNIFKRMMNNLRVSNFSKLIHNKILKLVNLNNKTHLKPSKIFLVSLILRF